MTEQKSRQLFLMRHGERIDFTFGKWIPTCFDQSGNYTRTDLNMPESLPKRNDGYENFLKDSPLTRVGLFQGEITGEAFKKAGLDVTHVYCSPSLRCVQTCDAFLKGCKRREQIKIKIEPGLFEWLEWYSAGVPKYMTLEELQESGFNIDLEYKPLISVEQLGKTKENLEEFYARSYSVTKHALNADQNGNVLFVGHSSTLDVCSRQLVGKKPLPFLDFAVFISKVPYCGFLQLNQKERKWEIAEKQILGITHTKNSNFDRKIMVD